MRQFVARAAALLAFAPIAATAQPSGRIAAGQGYSRG